MKEFKAKVVQLQKIDMITCLYKENTFPGINTETILNS